MSNQQPHSDPSLTSRSIDALFWGAGGAVTRLLLQIGTQVVLARLLGPEQYGIFAIAAVVVGFSAFFSDIGLAYGLIQKPSVSPDDVRFVFTWQLVLGALTAGCAWAAAPAIAHFFGEPRAADVVAVLALLCLLNALTAPSLNLLKRRLDQRAIQLAQLAAYVVGYVVVGVPLALAGWGVWALVSAWLVQGSLQLLLLYQRVRHPLALLAWTGDAAAQLRYGGTVFVTNLVNWLVLNIDRVIVGRIFGSRDIGLYSTTVNLMAGPSSAALGVVQTVLFAASARASAAPHKVVAAYLAAVAGLCLFALPAFAVVSVLAVPIVALLYGPAWAAAAPLLQVLALAMPLYLLFGLTTPLLWTAGAVSSEFIVQLPIAVVWLLACCAASTVSLQAVAWTVLALYGLRAGVVVVLACRARGIRRRAVAGAMLGGATVAAVVGASAAAAASLLAGHTGAPGQVAAGLAGGALAWLAMVRGVPRLVDPGLRWLLVEAAGRLPPLGRRVVAVLIGGTTAQRGSM